MKAVSRALNIELKEVDDWSCCGASAAHNTNFDLSIALRRGISSPPKKMRWM
jgi:heterodisulfide reductase subunit B